MLRLNFAATLAPIHIGLLETLVSSSPESGYDREDVNKLIDELIIVLAKLIPEAALYRVE